MLCVLGGKKNVKAQTVELSRESPHSCYELLGHAEDKEGKAVDNKLFFLNVFITASRLLVFI